MPAKSRGIFGFRPRRPRLTHAERARKIRHATTLEALEDRRLLAYIFTGGGTNLGTATSDGNPDTLYLQAVGGLILHSTDGVNYSPDWGAGLTIAASTANTINVAQGSDSNAHAVILGGLLSEESALQAQINIQGSGPNESLTVDDSLDTQQAIGATAYTVSTTAISGPPTMQISLPAGALGAGVKLLGGTADNTFNVQQTVAGEPLKLLGNSGNDTFNIAATQSPVTIDGGGGVNAVNIGVGGSVASIQSPVSVLDTGGTTNLAINTLSQIAGTKATDKINLATGLAEITGLAPATLAYAPANIQTLGITNNDNITNTFTLDFTNGNVLPSANGAAALNYSGGNVSAPAAGTNALNLVGTLPGGAWDSENDFVTGINTGSLTLTAPGAPFQNTINYSALSPHSINDVTPVATYAFNDASLSGAVEANAGPVFAGFQTLQIRSLELTPLFVDTNLANKTSLSIDLPQSGGASFVSYINYASASPVSGLGVLFVNQANAGDAHIIALPPGIVAAENQTAGPFTTEITGPGLPPGTTTTINGPAANGKLLTYDAGGLAAINTTNISTFFSPGVSASPISFNTTISGASFGAGKLVFNNYGAITVNNIAPVSPVVTGLTIAAVEGQPLTNVPVASFTSTAIGAKATDFSATINWGDGGPTSTGTIVPSAANPTLFYIYGSHTYTSASSALTPSVTVNSTGSSGSLNINGIPTTFNTAALTAPATAAFSATATDGPLAVTPNPLAATEGTPTPVGLVLGTFIDFGGAQATSNYTATINWGDGTGTHTLPASAITQNGTSNSYTVTSPVAHDYAEAGTFVFTLTITDKTSTPVDTVAVTATAVIADAALAPVASPPLSAVEGAPLTGQVASFTDANPAAVVSEYTATIFWGDGTSSLGVVTQPGGAGAFVVTGTHTYAEDTTGLAPYAVSTIITDDDGATTNTALTPTSLTVTDAVLTAAPGLSISATEGQPLSNVPVAAFTDANPSGSAGDFSATIDWGDGSATTQGVIQLVGGSAAGPMFDVLGTHTYTDNVNRTIKVTINDKGGAPAIVINSTATVSQAPIAVVAFPVAGTEGVPLTVTATPNNPGGLVLVGSFTDSGGQDAATSYSAKVAWGDGSTDNTAGHVKIVANGTSNYDVFAPTHSYAEEGDYTLTVSVTDADNQTVTVNASATAVIGDAAIAAAASFRFSVVEGAAFTQQVGSFTDVNPQAGIVDFTAMIQWGDGTSSLGVVSQPGGMGTVFIVTGTHTYPEDTTGAAPYSVTTVVTDRGGTAENSSLNPSFITVTDAALTAAPGLTIAATEGQPLMNVPVGVFTDANPFGSVSDFSATIDWGDGSAATTGIVQLIGGTSAGPTFDVLGSHTYAENVKRTITVTVTDKGGATPITITSTATVSQAPIAVTALPVVGTEGAALTPTPAANNPGGLVLVASFTDYDGKDAAGSYIATVAWGDGSADSTAGSVKVVADGTGTYSVFAPAHTYAEEGSYALTVSVTDNDHGPITVTAASTAVIADASLTALASPALTSVEGASLTGQVASFTDANPTSTVADFTAIIQWGDGTSSLGVVSQPGGVGTAFVVTGTHTYPEDTTGAAPFSVTAVITDDGGATTNTSLIPTLVTVTDAALTPLPGLTVAATEGQPLTNVPVAVFTDANPFGSVSDFSATIDWGDGSPLTTGTVQLIGGGAAGATFEVLGSHTYTDNINRTITVTVTDKGGAAPITITSSATVSQAPIAVTALPVSGTEGLALTPTPTANNPGGLVLVATFTDFAGQDDPASYAVTVAWGDGSADDTTGLVMVVANGAGLYDVYAPAHIYAEEGSYTLAVSVTDADNGPITVNASATAVIADAALTAEASPALTAVEGASFTAQVGSFTDDNLKAPISDFTATIQWGDGTSSLGVISQPGGIGTAFIVTGTHTYAEDTTGGAPYSVTTVITDDGGATTNTSAIPTLVAVNDALLMSSPGLTVQAAEGIALMNVPVAQFTDTNPFGSVSDFSATIDWGDGTPLDTGTVQLIGGSAAGPLFEVLGSHTYADNINRTITVTITDKGGAPPITIASTVIVNQSPILVTALPVTGTEGLALTPTPAPNNPGGLVLVGTFRDIDGQDPADTYNVTVAWGDGNSDTTAGLVQVVANGVGLYDVYAPAHIYADEGSYTLTVSVTDADQAALTVNSSATAVIADAPLTAVPSPAISSVEGASFTKRVASFTDANPTASVADFTATINWGDGKSSLGIVSQPGGPGTAFIVTGTHTYAEDTTLTAPYSVTTVITDDGGATTDTAKIPTHATVTDAVLVPSAGLALSAMEGQALTNATVAIFTDTNPFGMVSDFTASIDWGDGTPKTAGVVQLIGGGPAGPMFEVLGSHTYAGDTGHSITVTVTDKGGAPPITIISAITFTQAPFTVTAFPLAGIEGHPLTPTPAANNPGGLVLVGSFNDPGQDAASSYPVTVSWGDGTTDNTTAGNVKVVANGVGIYDVYATPHIYAEEGNYTFTLSVTDPDTTPLTVNASSAAVISDATLTAVQSPALTATEGQPLTNAIVATFTDANPHGTPSDFSAVIYWGDGTVSAGAVSQTGAPGTPFIVRGTHTYADETPAGSPFEVHVVITDVGGATVDTQTVPTAVTVNDASLTSTGAPVSAVEGTAFSNVPVATFTDSNPLGTASDFSATITWGDGSTSPGSIVAVSGNAQGAVFQVRGSHTYAEQGSFAISVAISDVGGQSTTATSTATVTDAALASQGATITGSEGNTTGSVLVATFTDANPLAKASDTTDFSATVSWGDGSSSSGAAVTIVGTGTPSGVVFQVFASHTYTDEGTYQTTTTIDDNGGSSTIAHGQAVIADAAITVTGAAPVTAVEGQPFTAQVASITDKNPLATPSDFTATIFWGDGTSTLGTVSGTGPFVVTGTHTYPEETGATPYDVKVSVVDKGGSTGDSSASPTLVTVNDAPLTAAVGLPVSAVEGQAFSNAPVSQFTDTNPAGTAADFTATITWGDGSKSSGVIVPVAGNGTGATFQVLGSHDYTEEGSFSISVAISDKGGASTSTTSTATVVDAPLFSQGSSITGIEGNSTGNVLVATFTDADPNGAVNDYTATINWGDGTAATPATSITSAGSPNGTTFSVAGEHTYAEKGTFQVTVTITDAGGSVTVAHTTAIIGDATLSSPVGVPVTGAEGAKLVAVPVLTFADNNPLATPADFTASIDWGDNVQGTGKIVAIGVQNGQALFQIVGNHTYTDEGSYPIHVDVFDVDGMKTAGDTTATISDAALVSATGIAVKAVENQALANVPVATFIDSNKFGTIGDFSATIDWGDGTTTSGVITQVSGNASGVMFQVAGSHTYAEEGSFPITVQIADVGGQTATVSAAAGNGASATVADAPVSGQAALVSGVEGLGLSQAGGAAFGPVVIGSFTDSNQASTVADFTVAPGSVTVNWGDGSAVETLTAANLSASGAANGVVYTITDGHVYKDQGTYQVTITVHDAGGATAVLHGMATIADATLSQSPTQPTVHTTESPIYPVPVFANPIFSGAVGQFDDANPNGPVSDFKATIDWGDGTPLSFGTISQPGGPGSPFVVSGSHTYADAGVTTGSGTSGTFPLTIHVKDVGGASLTVTNSATVDDRSIALSGKLNPASDSGISNSDDITNVNQPSFLGTSEPRSSVTLLAVPQGGGAPITLGATRALSNGAWALTSGVALPDGVYTVEATAVDQFGMTTVTVPPSPVVITPTLMIDTHGPKVASVFFDRLNGQIDITYTDNLSGLLDRTLVDAANYSFSKVHIAKQKGGLFLVTSATVMPGGNATTENVVLTLTHHGQIRGGFYNFVIHAASVIFPSGVQDVAGNALDGEFYGFFPSGNGINGGDFAARLDAIHNLILPPATIVGPATPNVPPGTKPSPVRIPTTVPPKGGNGSTATGHKTKIATPHPTGVMKSAAHASVSTKHAAHDTALGKVNVPKPRHRA
jgi:hypothetical protein